MHEVFFTLSTGRTSQRCYEDLDALVSTVFFKSEMHILECVV